MSFWKCLRLWILLRQCLAGPQGSPSGTLWCHGGHVQWEVRWGSEPGGAHPRGLLRHLPVIPRIPLHWHVLPRWVNRFILTDFSPDSIAKGLGILGKPEYGFPRVGISAFVRTLLVSLSAASVLHAMAVLVCAEMYQVKRLQHLCEVCVCAYLQGMPSRELSTTGISVIRLLRRAKVPMDLRFKSITINVSVVMWLRVKKKKKGYDRVINEEGGDRSACGSVG